jgi:uncharacterized protein YbjT (DUF2867 family)
MILAVGAAGKFAGMVVPELVKRGEDVRGLIHKPEEAARVRKAGAVEVVVGDLMHPEELDAALEGVEQVFYIAPAFLANEGDVGKRFLEAAKRAGVRRFVFSALMDPVLTSLPHHAAKIEVESAVLDSGLEYTFLHPAVFFQNYGASWAQVMERGVLAEPWSVDTAFSRVDYRDVAEVAAMALTEDRLLYGTFELCAPGWLNRREVATLMSKVVGREIRAERRDPAELGDIPGRMKLMYEYYDTHDLLGNSMTLRALLGREPRSLKEYFKELAAKG